MKLRKIILFKKYFAALCLAMPLPYITVKGEWLNINVPVFLPNVRKCASRWISEAELFRVVSVCIPVSPPVFPG